MVKLITSEFVGVSHPDILADSISDSIVDISLARNKNARVAIETMVVGDNIILGGELSGVTFTKEEIDNAVLDIVKLNDNLGLKLFKPDKVKIQQFIRKQSEDIAMGVDGGDEISAGDQGFQNGYSNNHNEDRLPMSLYLSRLICHNIYKLNEGKTFPIYYNDIKSQVTIEYDDETRLFGKIKNVICSVHHNSGAMITELRNEVKEFIIKLINEKYPNGDIENANFYINATGLFTIGGPDADSGVTGRKLAVMSFGGQAYNGGGALSGKDPSKVDRSGAYFTRYVCNNIINQGLANVVEISVAYCIGKADPMSITLVQNDKKENESKIIEYINSFNFKPKSMIEQLKLNEQKYVSSARYGAFGKNPDGIIYPWENI